MKGSKNKLNVEMNKFMIHAPKITALYKSIRVRFSGKEFLLPEDVQQKIDMYWEKLVISNPYFRRGEVYTVVDVRNTPDMQEFIVSLSDYAHYMYTQEYREELGQYAVQNIYSSVIMNTKDNKTIIGKMHNHTAKAGVIQLCGGGLDNNDLREDGVFDLDKNMSREIFEELGVNIMNKDRVIDFKPAFMKEGGKTSTIAIVYQCQLQETAKEFMEQYKKFEKELLAKNENPEFSEIFCVPITTKGVRLFLQNHTVINEGLREILSQLVKIH